MTFVLGLIPLWIRYSKLGVNMSDRCSFIPWTSIRCPASQTWAVLAIHVQPARSSQFHTWSSYGWRWPTIVSMVYASRYSKGQLPSQPGIARLTLPEWAMARVSHSLAALPTHPALSICVGVVVIPLALCVRDVGFKPWPCLTTPVGPGLQTKEVKMGAV